MVMRGAYSMANYTIINDDELSDYIASLLIVKTYSNGPNWHFCNKVYTQHYNGVKPVYSDSIKRINKAVDADIDVWRKKIKQETRTIWKYKRRKLAGFILDNIDRICSAYGNGNVQKGKRLILNQYLESASDSYMKKLSAGIFEKSKFRSTVTYSYPEQDCLIRNILNNEDLLQNKISNNFPLWFIDSGYTNFIRDSESKEWHRLCRNDIHADLPKHTFPMDRLLKIILDNRNRLDGFRFPRYWRAGGDTILIIPPSLNICTVYGLNQTKWIVEQEKKLRTLTDKKIVVREKIGNRKTRTSLYRDLLADQSIYCVVGYNSNALTESIWAGVPVITLGKHITNPVSRSSLDKINNLYRDDISQGLCYLSYSQFTTDELVNGTAKKILETWHV